MNGSYGDQRIPSSSNYPGSREYHSMVFNPSLNSLIVFGGNGYDEATSLGKYES